MAFKGKAFKALVFTVLLFAGLMFTNAKSTEADMQSSDVTYITTRAELIKALSEKRDVIYVGDIEFDEKDIYVQIDQSVRLVGKEGGSVFRKALFNISGPGVESELINVSLENITFDGGYVSPSGNPGDASSFDAFHGDRSGKGCFTVKGFVGLTVKNCCIKNYCTKYGAAMYLQYTDGNADMGTRAKVSVSNCTFSGNICEKGVFWCNGKNTSLEMSDCTFTGNHAYTGIVTLGGIKGTVEGVTVKDNVRVVFKEKNSFPSGGGGILLANSEALIKNCLIEGNSAPYGGGFMSTGSKVTVDSCRIINNTADSFGGGMVLHSSETAPVYVTNCLISGNSAKEEGAVWVGPADQIGVGLPTGIAEISFCTIENNRSDDASHLVFHPVMLENQETSAGREGRTDYIACRIIDEKVTGELKNGENYNVINSDEKGAEVPEAVVKTITNGYYKDSDVKLYPGMNEALTAEGEKTGAKTGRKKVVAGICVVCGLLLAVAAFFDVRSRNGRRIGAHGKIKENTVTEQVKSADDPLKNTGGKAGQTGAVSAGGNAEKDPDRDKKQTDKRIEEFARSGMLTERETEVLKEYISGKSRSEISEALFISESTVKNHISNIFSKLKVKNKEGLLKLLEAASGN